jgi:diamine N-acetyltransferase
MCGDKFVFYIEKPHFCSGVFFIYMNTYFTEMTFIKNKNTSLRAVEKEDLPFLYKWENEESIRQFGSSRMPLSKYVLAQFINNANKDIFETKQLRFVIEHNESCEPIGMVDLFDFEPLDSRAGVGIVITEKYRNKGFATEALDSICEYAFGAFNLHQLYCHIAASNHASIKLFEKSGFSVTATLKDWQKGKEGFEDVVVLQKIN